MPTYEFECLYCGVFNKMRPMSEYRLDAACPTCNRDAARVTYTAPGLSSQSNFTAALNGARATGADPARETSAHTKGCGCCSRVVFPT